MYGLVFEERIATPAQGAPRGDIALFVGWCAWRADARISAALARWFDERLVLGMTPGDPLPLDRPVPFDTWAQFETVADWRGRRISAAGPERADTTLGVAVRDFFANGGRRCYVIALGEPWPLTSVLGRGERETRFAEVLPDFIDRERSSWKGLAQLQALDDVAQVLVPDLPELAASQRDEVEPSSEETEPAEVFVECAPRIAPRAADPGVLRLPAPRCDDDDYYHWRKYAQRIGSFLAQFRRDCHAILALPLPGRRARVGRDAATATTGLASSFVQIAYPWLKPVMPPRTPLGLVAPDGALAGLIAATALTRGAFRTAAGRTPIDVYDIEPLPPARELATSTAALDARAWTARLSLFAPRLDRIELLSDRTVSDRAGWRNAPVGRLMGQLLRLARVTGEAFAFEAAGESLFARVRSRFEDLLTALWKAGALRGDRPSQAFAVRCDRALMTQNDIDNGRVICAIEFAPSYSLERIEIELWLGESSTVGWREREELAEATA